MQVSNTPSAQKNEATCSDISKQSSSIDDVSNSMHNQAFYTQSPPMQITDSAETKKPVNRRRKQIGIPTESANEKNTRAKHAKTASVDVLPDQTSFIPIGNEMNINSVAIQPQIDEKPKRGKRKASKDPKSTEVDEMKPTTIGQSNEMNTNSAAILPQLQIDEKPKRGKRKASKEPKSTEVEDVKPKRGRQKKNEQIKSPSQVATLQELSPIVQEQVKPKRAVRRQNSATETVISEPPSSVEMVYQVKEVSQEPFKPKRGGRRQNSASETENVEPNPEVIDEKPGRRVLRKRTIDEAPPAPEMAKTTQSNRNVVEPIIEVEEPVVNEKPKRGRRKAVQNEIPTIPEYIESTVEVKTTRSKRRPTVDEDIPLGQSLNLKNGNQKKVQFQDEKPSNVSPDKISAHETSIKLDIEPINAEKKTTRKRTPKSKAVELDEAAYEAPRTRRGRKPKIEAVQETAEETAIALTRPRRAAKKP